MNVIRVEAFRLFQVLQHLSHVLDLALENRITGDITEVGEFQVHRADFREDAAPTARPTVILACLKIIRRNIVFD